MEEKKLTDEEIAKAILQQIEYNAGIPYINEWQQVKTIKFTEVLDFINRLQSNNEELKKDYIELDLECRELRTESDKKNTEIERLKDENIEQRDIHFKNLCEYKDEIARLEKQVDELKTENKELYKEHTTLIAGSILKQQDIVKETAQNALEEFICRLVNLRLVSTNDDLYVEMLEAKDDLLKEHYGVEVDYEN